MKENEENEKKTKKMKRSCTKKPRMTFSRNVLLKREAGCFRPIELPSKKGKRRYKKYSPKKGPSRNYNRNYL